VDATPSDRDYLFLEVVFMRLGRRYGLSSTQKIEIWRRWKAGESLHDIGRVFGKDHGSIHFLLSQHGGTRWILYAGNPLVQEACLRLAHSLRSQLFSSALLYNSSIFSEEGGFSMSNSGAFGKPVAAMRRLASARS
jgi:hypothetical protein